MRLNLGCGTDVREGWVNVDCVPANGVVVADLTKPLPFPDAVAEEVYASHVFEHLQNWPETMLECWRVLKTNGLLVVRVPYGVGPQNPDALHVRHFYPGTMDLFTMPKNGSPGLDAHRYNGKFEKVKQKVMRQMWYHWHIGHYFGLWFFEKFKYRFPPIGEKKEIVWVLKKVPEDADAWWNQ